MSDRARLMIWIYSCLALMASIHLSSTDEENDLQISDKATAWVDISSGCQMASEEHVKGDSLTRMRDILPIGEKVWLGARAKPTPYVSFYACMKPKSLDDLQTQTFQSNSLARCLSYCNNTKVFGLVGNRCVCIADVSKFSVSFEPCFSRCSGNLNDWCGNKDTFVSGYKVNELEVFQGLSQHPDQRCVALNKTTDTPVTVTSFPVTCSASYGFKCEQADWNHTRHSWPEALESCLSIKKIFDSTFNYKKIPSNTTFWTSVIRSTELLWDNINSESEFPWCVSIRKDKDSNLSFHEEDCESRHYHLLVCKKGNGDHIKNTDENPGPQFPVAIVASVAGVLLLVAISLVVYFCRQRNLKQHTRPKSFNNDFYDRMVPSKQLNASNPGPSIDKNRSAQLARLQDDTGLSEYASVECTYTDAAGVNVDVYDTTANTHGTSNRDTAKDTGKNVYDHTFATGENVYDHTNIKFSCSKESANVSYSHAKKIKTGTMDSENAYDCTSLTGLEKRSIESTYNHAGPSDASNQGEGVYNHTDSAKQDIQPAENTYGYSKPQKIIKE